VIVRWPGQVPPAGGSGLAEAPSPDLNPQPFGPHAQFAPVERRPFGTTGEEVPVIGQGTWQLRDPAKAIESLREGLARGMTHIDTAELYRGSEDVIREALRSVRRTSVFLVSKVLPHNASYEGTLRACEASLKRLGTDHLDAYLLHWWGSQPIEETMRAMGELADRGKTRFIGVSNLDVAELEEAQAALGRKHRIVCDQVLYHLGDRGIEEELLPHCAAQGVAVVGYSPYGSSRGGFPQPEGPAWQALEQVGGRHGRTPRQVALRFLTRHPSVFTIPKSEQVEHVRENAGAAGWQLDAEDIALLDSAFPPSARGKPLGML
jgi:diketogulonate reductase-like aldo/keto reductase